LGHTGYSHGAKLLKDDKSVIEELTTARNEFKKVNQFLIDEIESLKKENVYLKSELSRYVLCSSQTSSSSSSINNKSSITKNDDSSFNTSTIEIDKQSIDLTKYIDSEGSDSDDNNSPPLEFTVDS
jgi:hypothetical protein